MNKVSLKDPASVKEEWIGYIEDLQNRICQDLESADGKASFITDDWTRPEGGGGKTRVISNGNVFEKGGVNTSVVYGEVTEVMRSQLKIDGAQWFACGLSLVLHPFNPFVPTIHCNYRMFELYDAEGKLTDRWFGGGTDLTPYYIIEEDIRHFHRVYKTICDRYDPAFYDTFKKECDNYFVNWHRTRERRGVGGIFFDHRRPGKEKDIDFWKNFCKDCGNAFGNSYLPIVEKRKNLPFTERNKYWQEIRRGRYIEFNLVHDRGTLFGLKTNGRTESILMSLPPTARFDYDFKVEPGSEEELLLNVCLNPRDWI